MRTFKKNIYKLVNDTDIVFNPFDHMVVNFKYTKPADGTDLDLMVYYDNTDSVYDLDAVGYNQAPNSVKVPTDATADADSYLWWANDDVSAPIGECIESVVIGIKNFTDNVVSTGSTVEIALRAGWFGSINSGDVTVELVTYLGGTMSQVGTSIINTGGVEVNNASKLVNVTSCCSQVTLVHSNLLGTVIYNKTSKTAILV